MKTENKIHVWKQEDKQKEERNEKKEDLEK